MKLTLHRKFKGEEYSIGDLYIDGVFFCSSLEDVDRDLYNTMSPQEILSKKIKHETAVPYGRYRVTLAYSPKFKKILPLLHSVPGFDGILIHSGTTKDDTSGCILLGINSVKGKVTSSRNTMSKFISMLENALKNKDSITIDIVKEYKK